MASGTTPSAPNSGDAPVSDYPVQRHAGKIGYGPNYHAGASVVDKVGGVFEEEIGKVIHNKKLASKGHELHTGEAKKKQLLGVGSDDPIFDSGNNDSKGSKPPAKSTGVTASGANPHVNAATTVSQNEKDSAAVSSSATVPSKGTDALERVTSH